MLVLLQWLLLHSFGLVASERLPPAILGIIRSHLIFRYSQMRKKLLTLQLKPLINFTARSLVFSASFLD